MIPQEMEGPDFLNVHWRWKHKDFNDIRAEVNDVEFLETFVFMMFEDFENRKQLSYTKSRKVGRSAIGINMTEVEINPV